MSSFEQQTKIAGEIHLDAKIDELQQLLADIKAEKYTEVYQVEGHINSRLDGLYKLKGDQ